MMAEVIEIVDDADMLCVECLTVEPLKKRGRPKKEKVIDVEPKEIKKLGRPKKETVIDIEIKVLKKRGRKPGIKIGEYQMTERKMGPGYFKKYYLEKSKPQTDALERVTCPYCDKSLKPKSLKAHERDKLCNLLRECIVSKDS